MSTHTPGPWRSCYDCSIETADGKQVLGLEGFSGDTYIACNNPADLTLIAAAPDLLAALELCLARDSALRFNVTVMSAIAKARGES